MASHRSEHGAARRAHAMPAVPGKSDYAIESIRALAVMLLISYHVIGAGPHDGLQIDYPHPLRFAANFLADVRMPMFAMISGIVYALRPVRRDALAPFLAGKLRRLALPGATAITLFALLAGIFSTRFAATDIFSIYLFPYAHYWYLQSIIVIFIFYCTFDIFSDGKFLIPTLIIAIFLHISHVSLTNFFSISSSLYILPYFILGVILSRKQRWVRNAYPYVLAAAVIAMAIGFAINIALYERTGALSADRRDAQSLLAGFGICAFAALAAPSIKAIEWIGPPSFLIYLYHILGTSGMRRVLDMLHIQSIAIHLVLGVLAGVVSGYAIHRIAQAHPLARLVICGERARTTPHIANRAKK